MTVNKLSLEPKSNAIRNLNFELFSYETKEDMISTLKQNSNYVKNNDLKEEKIAKHKEKQDILTKLWSYGIDDSTINTIKKTLYPDYVDDIVSEKEWSNEIIKTMLQASYDKMYDSNKPYLGDLEKLQVWKGLKYREEAGTKIIDVPWFGELCSTIKSGTEYRDMDKDGKRSINNLKDSDKFKTFASTIKNCEMMSLSDTYKLMNLVAKQLGITDTIDENYINTVFKKDKNENLPLENPFGRVLRALYMMTGEWFIIPISVDGKTVRSVDCDDSSAWIYDHSYDGGIVRPFAKIRGSL
jgi:hypothetical protein